MKFPIFIRGGLLVSLAMMSLIVNDTVAKSLSEKISVSELILFRGLFAIVILVVALAAMGRLPKLALMLQPSVILCASMDLLVTFLFITALFRMPLPNLTALLQAAPLLTTLLAVVVLKEHVGWRRFGAVVTGLVGVVLVIKPGVQPLNLHVLSGVGALAAIAVRDLATRRIPAPIPSSTVALATTTLVTLAGFVVTAYGGFRPLSGEALGKLGVSALFLVIGYFLLVSNLRSQELHKSAPFRYTMIIWSMIAGWFVFGDVPDLIAFTGMALIAGSGVFTIYREARIRRADRLSANLPKVP